MLMTLLKTLQKSRNIRHIFLASAARVAIVTLLSAFVLQRSALSASRWTFQFYGEPSSFEVKSAEPSAPIAETKINVDASRKQPGRAVANTFYGAVLEPQFTLPERSVMARLPLAVTHIGGNEYSRFDFESGLVSQRFYDGPDSLLNTKPKYLGHILWPEIVTIARSIKTEPIVQVNMLGFKPTFNAQGVPETIPVDSAAEAYRFVYHLNKQHNLGVRYFSVDNEPTLWADTHFDLIKEPISADDYIQKFIRLAIAMRTAADEIHQDPNFIKIFGPEDSSTFQDFQTLSPQDCVEGECRYGRGSGILFENFLDYFLYKIGKIEKDTNVNPKGYKLLDYLSFHVYPLFRYNYFDPESFLYDSHGRQDVSGYLRSIRLWDTDQINTHDYVWPRNKKIAFYPFLNRAINAYYPQASIALTEFGIDSSGSPIDYHPLLKPLYEAEFYAISAYNGVEMFAKVCLNSNDYDPQFWYLVSEGRKLTPSFHAMSLMARYFKGDFVNTELMNSVSSGLNRNENLVAYSVVNTSETATLIINKDVDKEHKTTIAYGAQSAESYQLNIPPLTMAIVRKIPGKNTVVVHQFGQAELRVRNNRQ